MDFTNLIPYFAAGTGIGAAYAGIRALLPAYQKNKHTQETPPDAVPLTRTRTTTRNSNVLGFYSDAIRHGDGGFTKAYLLEPLPTVYGFENQLISQIDRWATLLRANKPTGTIIQFRFSSITDPGELVLNHLQETQAYENLNPNAVELHTLGLAQTIDGCNAGRYRLPRISVWIKTPPGKYKGNVLDDIKLGWQTRGWKGAQDAMSQVNRILTRLEEDERQAYREANKIFRAFEMECPVPFRALSPQETWDALYLSHRQDAITSPTIPPPQIDVRDYLCAETISAKGWYAMHGSVPVAMISMLTPPQPAIEAELMRRLTVNGNLNFCRWTLIHEYITIDGKKAEAKLTRRYSQAERAARTSTGAEKKDKKAEAVIRELDHIMRDVAASREAMVALRSYVVLYGPSCKTAEDLRAALHNLDEHTEAMITTFRSMAGADVRREEPAAIAALYPKTLVGEYTHLPNGREIEEVAGSLAALIPQEIEWRGSRRCHTIVSTPTNSLFGLNFFDANVSPSPTGIVIAASGNGKSVLLSKIITDFLATAPNGKVKAIDYREGFAVLTEVLGGRHIKMSPDTKRTINIWDFPGFSEDNDVAEAAQADLQSQAEIVTEFYLQLSGYKTDLEEIKAVLQGLVKNIYQQFFAINKKAPIKRQPTLSHLLDELATFKFETATMQQHVEKIRTGLSYYRDEYFLDSPTHPDFQNETSFDVYETGTLAEFSKEVKNALAYAIVVRVLRSVGKPINGVYPPYLLIGDEMNELRKNFPNIVGVFERAARVGRKENTVTLLAAQSYEDIGDIPAFSKNAGFRIIGKQTSTTEMLSAHAGLSPMAESAIHSIRNVVGSHAQFVGVFSSNITQKVEMLQLELSPVELWINTSDPRERNARNRVQALRPNWALKDCIGWLASTYPNGLTFAGLTAIDESLLGE